MPGATIKAVLEGHEWVLDVLGCPFGGPHAGRDTHGEFFSPDTNFYPEQFSLPPVVYYHGFDPNQRPLPAPAFIGKAVRREVREDGVWYRVVLDQAQAFAQRVWDAARAGLAKASSGSVLHLRRIAPNGHITHWPVAELSVWDAVAGRDPANAYAVALPAIKSLYEQAGINLPAAITEDIAMATPPAQADGVTEVRAGLKPIPTPPAWTEDDVKRLVQDGIKAALTEQAEQQQHAQQAEVAIQERIDAAVKIRETELSADYAKNNRLPSGEAPMVAKFAEIRRFDNLDAADTAVLISVLDAASAGSATRTGASESALKALAIKLDEDTSLVGEVGRSAMKAEGLATKANEIMQQSLTGAGRDWVGVAYSQAIWDRIRIESFVAANLPSIEVPQGSESIVLPLEGADPVFYKVAEAASIDTTGAPPATVRSSKLGTENRQLTVSKMGARVLWSGEMEEDSLIPFVPQLRGQLATAGMEQFEHLLIDGDTATAAAANINHAGTGGTPAADDLYTLFDGFRKLALMTNSANSRNVNAALSLKDFLETVKLMGPAGINGLDRKKVGFIVDPLTYYAAMQLTQVQTRDLFSSPTIEGGELTGLYGYRLRPSGFIAAKSGNNLTNATGKVDQTALANNIKGQILAIRWDQWMLGYKRRMTTEVTRIPRADANEIVCLMRVGLRNRDQEGTALSYNITI